MAQRGKRRAENQKNGRKGELLFAGWAHDHGLNPHQSDLDIGVDYFCEVLQTVETGAAEVTGGILLAAVRSTVGKTRPRIKTEREMITTALRQDAPYCLFGVALHTGAIYFRFLDEALFDEWTSFLASDTPEDTSMRLDRMMTGDTEFAQGLRKVSRPAFRSRLEQKKVEVRLQEVLPEAELHVRGGEGGWSLVTVPTLPSILRLQDEEQKERARQVLFTPQSFTQNFAAAVRQFSLHEPFDSVARLVDGPVIVAGGTEVSVTLFAEHGNLREESEFIERRVGDERAYIGSSGLVLRISDPRPRGVNGSFHHDVVSTLISEGANDLQSSGQLPFLRLLRTGGTINKVGQNGLKVEMFGLEALGEGVSALEFVLSRLRIPLTEAYLADFAKAGFGEKIGFLEAALNGTLNKPFIPPFVLLLEKSEEVDEHNWRECRYRVPVVLNLKGRGVVVWTEGEGYGYLHKDLIRGFRAISVRVADVSATFPEYEDVAGIEAWVCKEWAPVPINVDRPQTLLLKNRGPRALDGELSF